MRQWKIEGKHKWVAGATITESHNKNRSTYRKIYCRFTATIRGYQNWKIFEGFCDDDTAKHIQTEVMKIRDLIDKGDKLIFYKRY